VFGARDALAGWAGSQRVHIDRRVASLSSAGLLHAMHFMPSIQFLCLGHGLRTGARTPEMAAGARLLIVWSASALPVCSKSCACFGAFFYLECGMLIP